MCQLLQTNFASVWIYLKCLALLFVLSGEKREEAVATIQACLFIGRNRPMKLSKQTAPRQTEASVPLAVTCTLEFVSDVCDRHDDLRLPWLFLEFSPQAPHVGIDCARECTGVVTPNRTQ
jgi:hypothetical protein